MAFRVPTSAIFILLMLLLLTLPSAQLRAQDTPTPAPESPYQLTEIVDDFDSPLLVTSAPGDAAGRLFVVEQAGLIQIVQDGVMQPEPFLDIFSLLPNSVIRGGYTERGLLGLAFHPDYQANGLFFVNYTNPFGATTIARYQVMVEDPNHADPSSGVMLLTIDQPYHDHNGGNLAFGPDGYLYIGMGDGGNFENISANGQDTTKLLGKMLRIDVSAETYSIPPDNPFLGVEGYAPEIWAVGLRNPWRFSFDSATGDLYIADVGQWNWEEVNFQVADSPGGENYGWDVYEGLHDYKRVDNPPETVAPIIEYGHVDGCSVTGGYVYRGSVLPELVGHYIYGDYCAGRIWSAVRDESGAWQSELLMDTGLVISSFGVDTAGELYVVDYQGGAVYRLEQRD